MTVKSALMEDEDLIQLDIDPASRVARLRELYWDETHNKSVVRKKIVGSGEDTLVGHAKDFAALLEASDPFIQPDELIVGSALATPEDEKSLNLGEYNSHYPPGHETILEMGLTGIRDDARERLAAETDPEKREFLQAVEIAYDAACKYVEKHSVYASELAASESDPQRVKELEKISAVCHELSTGKPNSFHAALQLVQFTRVLGGLGCIGRFDQWVYPFYKKDVEEENLTGQEAQELLDCLWIKLNHFRFYSNPLDSLRNLVLAGQTVDGKDACNELTFRCLEASAKIMLTEPKLNVRFFKGSPRKLLVECCRVLAKGVNSMALYNDEVAVPALTKIGIPIEDARDYCNDGCEELIIGGKGTIKFTVYDSIMALRETVLEAENHEYETFDDVMADFKSRLIKFMPKGKAMYRLATHPYFAASIKDCLAKASPTGVRHAIMGSILAQVGNSSDGLAAIKKLIYEDKTLTWKELVAAIKADYEGYEPIRQMIINRAPKFGNDDDYVDSIAKEITEYYCDEVHRRGQNTEGNSPKWAAGLMCFGMQSRRYLPATPDGRRKGDLTANGFSPSVGMDKSGPTAVFKSIAKVDLAKAPNGSVLDIAMHTSAISDRESFQKLVNLIESFLEMPCTVTLQMNVIDRDTLLKARANPEDPEYRTLVVRVWGFSAVFVELIPDLQDHVIARTEHGF